MTITDVVTVDIAAVTAVAADIVNIVIAVMDINFEAAMAPAAVEQVITGVVVDVVDVVY